MEALVAFLYRALEISRLESEAVLAAADGPQEEREQAALVDTEEVVPALVAIRHQPPGRVLVYGVVLGTLANLAPPRSGGRNRNR